MIQSQMDSFTGMNALKTHCGHFWDTIMQTTFRGGLGCTVHKSPHKRRGHIKEEEEGGDDEEEDEEEDGEEEEDDGEEEEEEEE